MTPVGDARLARDDPRKGPDELRVYTVARTAHLERVRADARVRILYRRTRYDFDRGLARAVDARRVGLLGAWWAVFLSDARRIEVNEPLQLDSVLLTAMVQHAVRCRRLLRRRDALVASYAIGNADPFDEPVAGPRHRLVLAVAQAILPGLVRRLDRIVYGTPGARTTYERRLPGLRGEAFPLIPALPAARPTARHSDRAARRVVYLGALVERKGFDLLVEAWPRLAAVLPDARLVVLGKGPLAPRARALAAGRDDVDFLQDPARETIFAELERSHALVLVSQPRPHWREQVGLPIVEALASGCEIVTTEQTGLAAWLADHEHTVVPSRGTPDQLVDAIVTALRRPLRAGAILDALPREDGRAAAAAALFAAGPRERS